MSKSKSKSKPLKHDVDSDDDEASEGGFAWSISKVEKAWRVTLKSKCKVEFFRVDPRSDARVTTLGLGSRYRPTADDVGFKILAVAYWEDQEITQDLGLVEPSDVGQE